MRASSILFALAACILAPRVRGQEPEPAAVRPVHAPPIIEDSVFPADSAPRKPGCWRAAPPPSCKGFFLTEFGLEAPLHSSRSQRRGARRVDYPLRLNWAIGFMVSSGRNSHGGAVAITSEETFGGLGINIAEYRYRRWLGGSTIDVGLGYKSNGVLDSTETLMRGRGVTAMAGYTPNRWIGLQLRGDLVRSRGRTHHGVLLGLQSTRASEFLFRGFFYATIRALLGAIGFEWEHGSGEESEL